MWRAIVPVLQTRRQEMRRQNDFALVNYEALVELYHLWLSHEDRICGLVVRVPRYKSRGPGSIPGALGFSEK
jgi:hypothetical protein